jgi:hypothetical protein
MEIDRSLYHVFQDLAGWHGGRHEIFSGFEMLIQAIYAGY